MSHRAGLDQKAIVQAAVELVDTKGVEQLSLAQLAAQLGVRTPSLYNHISGLDGLRRELALYGSKEILARVSRAAVGKAKAEANMAIADAYRSFAKEHPGLYTFILRAIDPADLEMQAAGQELLEIMLAVLAPYGLSGNDALHAVRGLRSIVHGFVSLEAAGGFGMPLDLDESFHRLVRIFVNGLKQDNSS